MRTPDSHIPIRGPSERDIRSHGVIEAPSEENLNKKKEVTRSQSEGRHLSDRKYIPERPPLRKAQSHPHGHPIVEARSQPWHSPLPPFTGGCDSHQKQICNPLSWQPGTSPDNVSCSSQSHWHSRKDLIAPRTEEATLKYQTWRERHPGGSQEWARWVYHASDTRLRAQRKVYKVFSRAKCLIQC